MRKFKTAYVTSIIFLCVIIGFMFSAVCAYAWKKINDRLNSPEEKQEIKIDWEAMHPFEAEIVREERKANIFERIYNHVKGKCEEYSSKALYGYRSIVESAKLYEEFTGWNMASVFDYNAVVKLHDGYLTTYVESRDITVNAESTIELAEFCRQRGIDFFYANLPTKICIHEDRNISGVLDFANQNADRFLAMLDASGVRNYDFRKLLHEDGMNHHESFYVTDHHWKAETGLWAAKHILRILRDDYGYNVKPDMLNSENFDYVIYPEWFLGSRGKKITLARTKPDDFTMIYPKRNTNINFEIPDMNLKLTGDFQVMYNMKNLETKNYWKDDAYSAYTYGTRPFTRIKNADATADKKVLIFKDSFSNTVVPFLAMCIKNIEAVDLRHMITGSVRKYIDLKRPDAIIVMYYSGRFAQPGYGDREKNWAYFYDFR